MYRAMKWLKQFSTYQIGIFLSATSLFFGCLREFIIVGMLGFSAKNDLLQLYLSIFYTIGLMIDAMRLSCLNLFSILSLREIILSASMIAIPFAIIVGCTMSYLTGGLDGTLLVITIIGGYLNLIAALLITYKQRNNIFLTAQIINVLPNFILIPGIMLSYFFLNKNMIFSIVLLTSLIPLVQCVLLFCLNNPSIENIPVASRSLLVSILTFLRHFLAMVGEQLFQIITRSAFFQFGTGYLSLFSLSVRTYAAFRFILIDSYIGSKLFSWNSTTKTKKDTFLKIIQSTFFSCLVALAAFLLSLKQDNELHHAYVQVGGVLLFGFYFSTIVRIMYFKINHHKNDPTIVLRFALYELLFAGIAFVLTQYDHYSLFLLLWIGFVAKPLTQIFVLRKKYFSIQLSQNSVTT